MYLKIINMFDGNMKEEFLNLNQEQINEMDGDDISCLLKCNSSIFDKLTKKQINRMNGWKVSL